MSELTITKSWTNLTDFYNSEEMQNLWAGIRGRKSQMRSAQKWHNQGDIVFQRGIMVNGDLYKLYEANGINRIVKMTTYNCVSNTNVSMFEVTDSSINVVCENLKVSKETMSRVPDCIFWGNL